MESLKGGKRPGSGRPCNSTGIRVKARKYVDDAIAALSDVAKNSTDPSARVDAAKALLTAATGEKGAGYGS